MSATKDDVEDDTWVRLGLDNDHHHAATEQIDWSSFVNLEYDPTRPIAPTACLLATAESDPQKFSIDSQDCSIDRSLPSTEDVSEFANLDFPALEDWWAELPNEIQSGDWVWPAETAVLSGNTPQSESNSSIYTEEYSPKDGEGSNGKRPRRIPPEARRLLADSFERHREDPYIPKSEVQQLATETGLSIRQVQIFFANARARKLPSPNTKSKGVDIPAPPNQQDQQGPMERFLSSSPEDEGISEDAVQAAAKVMNRPIKPARSRKGRAPSVRSSSQSSTSNSSSASMDSLDSRGSRKGRKRQREPSHNSAKSIFRKPSSPSRKYQCTFCTHDFEQKYDWKRHEESVHFPQKEWVCMPKGPVEGSRCVFCSLENVDDEHLRSHKSIICSEAAWALRTFQRKDKLAQHIKQVHGCQPPKMIKDWCRPIERRVLLLCGFCSLELPDWKTRADHLSSHFNNGIIMTLWLPELIGGIWPADEITSNFVRDRFSATEHPEGQITCEACPARFLNLRNLTLHRRQVHNIFLPTDSRVVMSKPTTGHHSQRLINLAQQTSRIQIARLDGPSGGTAPQKVRPHGPVVTRPDYTAVFSKGGRSIPFPMGMRPDLNQVLDEPEHRGFSAQPHSVWRGVLNSNIVAGPRAPMRSPLNQQRSNSNSVMNAPSRTPAKSLLSQQPAVPASHRASALRSQDPRSAAMSHTELAAEAAANAEPWRGESSGPPVEAIRSILIHNRDDVGQVGRPVQGMLHSLEQLDDADAQWPRPPDYSFL